ncbi:MAG: hypothetical protein WDM80_17150 [Limisphaerales bacterium]
MNLSRAKLGAPFNKPRWNGWAGRQFLAPIEKFQFNKKPNFQNLRIQFFHQGDGGGGGSGRGEQIDNQQYRAPGLSASMCMATVAEPYSNA